MCFNITTEANNLKRDERMSYLNLNNKKLMNIGGDEYKRESGDWHLMCHALSKWIKCTHEQSRFLSWVAANENN
jgi:hypothetical protein